MKVQNIVQQSPVRSIQTFPSPVINNNVLLTIGNFTWGSSHVRFPKRIQVCS